MANSKINIHSDGDNHIATTDSGEKIDNVIEASIDLSPNEPVGLTLSIRGTPLNISASLTLLETKCPACSEITYHQCGGARIPTILKLDEKFVVEEKGVKHHVKISEIWVSDNKPDEITLELRKL